MHNFLFNLFKGLSLFRAPLKIILFLSHSIERAHHVTIIWNVHPPKTHNAQESFCFVLVS